MKVLLALDGSPCSTAAVDYLIRTAPFAEVTLMTILEPRPPLSTGMTTWEALRDELEEARTQAHSLVEQVAARLREAGFTTDTLVRDGATARQVVSAAEEIGADLVVVGSHGHAAITRLVLGSVSHSVVLHAPCSVLVARPPAEDDVARILLAHDGSASADAAVDWLSKSGFAKDAEVTVMSVIDLASSYRADFVLAASEAFRIQEEERQAALEAAAERLRPHVRAVDTILEYGIRAYDAILARAEALHAGLIVVGDKGQSAFKRFMLGSVSHRVADRAASSVLVVRAE